MFEFCLRALLSLIIVSASLLVNFISRVQGNTEVINFAASLAESPNMTFPDWTQLAPSNKDILLELVPVLDAIEVTVNSGAWLTLDLDDPDWSSYDKFTLRASWSAAHPCDIQFEIFDPLHVASQLLRNRPLHPTRKKYAHVYAINTGVPTPSSTGENTTRLRHEPVPITLVLEPLLLGAVPQSVVPVILVVVVAIGFALILLPYIQRYYGRLINKVQEEITHVKRE